MSKAYSTGLTPATPADLRGLAWDVEQWRRGDFVGARDLEARICAALLSHQGWEYVPRRDYEPPVREGRKIVKRAVEGVGPRIYRAYFSPGDATGYGRMSGQEEAPAPQILSDIGQAFGLLHGRVLIALSDIAGDGLSFAHVGGGEAMRADGKSYGCATLAATLVAAVLRCEAMEREAAAVERAAKGEG